MSALARAGASAHAFVEDLDEPLLDPDDARHLARVLRLRPGETVTVADGAGRWRAARWTGVTGAEIEAAGAVELEPRAVPAVTVGFSLLKGDRPEWIVQKLTELGVDRIVPIAARRSVVAWDAGRAASQVDRWRRIAREAAMQSRRAWLPEIADVTGLADAVAAAPGAALAELGGAPPTPGLATVFVGPEGGWDDTERETAPAVALAATVLRAETAAVAAATLLCALRAGLVRGA